MLSSGRSVSLLRRAAVQLPVGHARERSQAAFPYCCCAVLQCSWAGASPTASSLLVRSWPSVKLGLDCSLSVVALCPEQIELQAKLLNYFLGSNKSNINQSLARSCRPLSDSCLTSPRVSQVRWLLPARSRCCPVGSCPACECRARVNKRSFSQAVPLLPPLG